MLLPVEDIVPLHRVYPLKTQTARWESNGDEQMQFIFRGRCHSLILHTHLHVVQLAIAREYHRERPSRSTVGKVYDIKSIEHSKAA